MKKLQKNRYTIARNILFWWFICFGFNMFIIENSFSNKPFFRSIFDRTHNFWCILCNIPFGNGFPIFYISCTVFDIVQCVCIYIFSIDCRFLLYWNIYADREMYTVSFGIHFTTTALWIMSARISSCLSVKLHIHRILGDANILWRWIHIIWQIYWIHKSRHRLSKATTANRFCDFSFGFGTFSWLHANVGVVWCGVREWNGINQRLSFSYSYGNIDT